MIVTARIEQTPKTKERLQYDPRTDTFFNSGYSSLLYERGFRGYYGWICESGTPPGKHLDIILVTSKKLSIGDTAQFSVIGCFKRADNDHKIVAVDPENPVTDLHQLPDIQLANLKGIYPRIDTGEGWFGCEEAFKMVRYFIED